MRLRAGNLPLLGLGCDGMQGGGLCFFLEIGKGVRGRYVSSSGAGCGGEAPGYTGDF